MILRISTLIALCLMVAVTTVKADPVTIDSSFLFREVRSYQDGTGPTAGGFIFATDVIQFGVSTTPLSGTTAVANTSLTGENFPLLGPPNCGGSISSPNQELCREVEYTSQRANGEWTVEATNGGDMATANLGTLGDPVVPPFATDVLIDVLGDGSLDIGWLLPTDTGTADRIRLRIHNVAGQRLFQEVLAVDATSILVPTGVVTDPGTYWARVMLEETQSDFVRASTFAEFQIPVPEPTTLLLLGVGLAGLGFARRCRLNA